jgi:hypothetical protein
MLRSDSLVGVSFSVEEMRHLEAAEGWLGLGLPDDASAELENITPALKAHPHVLKLRWRVFAEAGKHYSAFAVADGLARLLPEEPEPFLWRSYSARRMKQGGLQMAIELLLTVVNQFHNEPVFPFNLACYNCQLGNLEVARSWLHVAFEVAERNGTTQHWATKALDDPDLEALRKSGGVVATPQRPACDAGVRGSPS